MDALTSMDMPVSAAVQQSFDEADDDDGWLPGSVFEISTVKQVTDFAKQHSSQKVILMCKSKVRPPACHTTGFLGPVAYFAQDSDHSSSFAGMPTVQSIHSDV